VTVEKRERPSTGLETGIQPSARQREHSPQAESGVARQKAGKEEKRLEDDKKNQVNNGDDGKGVARRPQKRWGKGNSDDI